MTNKPEPVEASEAVVPEGPYIIKSGYYFDDERTGKRFAVLTCSEEQDGGSWLELEEETAIGRSLTCQSGMAAFQRRNRGAYGTHKKVHPVISRREAVEWGVLDVTDGSVLIANDWLLWFLRKRTA